MKLLLLADVEEPYIWDHFDYEKFKDIDLVISCGDLKAEYLSFIVTFIKAPLFYVPGNHNGSYERQPPEGCENIDGQLIEYKGLRFLGLGGCMWYGGGPYQYTEKQMQQRINKFKFKLWRQKGFDILVTHAPAFGLGDGKDICHTGYKAFVDLMDRYSPKYFFHGHQHLNYGMRQRTLQYKNTTIVNAYGYYIIEI